MNGEAWPTPHESSREPLPRVEDLPIAEQGYEPDSVRAAFDSFYRHAAQLDAALRTLEAVDSFHRQASALRADIRTLRSAGWTQQPWSTPPAYGYVSRAPREGVSPAVWRIAGEAAFLIGVAVALGVAKLIWWLIVLVMAVAWLLVGLLEWAASRDRFAAPRRATEPAPPVVERAPRVERSEEEPLGWAAYEEAQEPSDAMTMIGAPPTGDEPAVAQGPPVDGRAEPAEPEPEIAASERQAAVPEAGEPEAAEHEPQVEEPEPQTEEPEPQAQEPEPQAEEPELQVQEPEPQAEEPEPQVEAAIADDAEDRAPEPVAALAEPLVGDAAEHRAAAPPSPKRRWWKRRSAGEEPPLAAAPTPAMPRHVRIIGADEHDDGVIDPWEAGFDAEPVGEPGVTATAGNDAEPEPDEETGEDTAAVARDADEAGRRRFRRR